MYTVTEVTENYTKDTLVSSEVVTICKKENVERFKETFKEVFPDKSDEDAINSDILKFLRYGAIMPIHKQNFMYLVSPNGQTLRCLNNPNKNN